MTLIEFFDKTPVDNIAAALALRPKRIVYIGTERQKLSSALPHIRKILTAHGMKTALTMRLIRPNDLSGILEVLREILSREDEYIFDFTGGDDMALVALGMVFRMTGRKTGVFRLDCDTRLGTLYRIPADTDGAFAAVPFDGTLAENRVDLTLEEGIRLHRGQIREEMISFNTAAGFPFTAETYRELNRLWKLCRSDCGYWNSQIGRLGAALRPTEESRLVYTLSAGMRGVDESFLAALTDGKFIRLESQGKSGLWRCTFENLYLRDCLTKSGTLLEYKTYMTALYWPHGTGPSSYTDGGAGVVIDWKEAGDKTSGASPRYTTETKRSGPHKSPVPATTRNEIDTLLMKGLVHVFISCKNG